MKTQTAFCHDVKTLMNKYPSMRKGQAMMCTLFEYDRNLYTNITNTSLDPFYDDKLIPGFLTKVYKEWNVMDYTTCELI